jgi:hypothetical protein
MTWRARLAAGVLAVWVLVSAARLTRLVEPGPVPPGQEVLPMLDFLRATIPSDTGYLFVLPGEFGSDTGTGPRLRYELYPRRYDDIRASQDEAGVRALMQREDLRFIVVTDAAQYAADHWLRQPHDWLRRIPLDQDRYVLAVTS